MIEVRGLTKRYGKRLAVSGLSFELGKGSLSGLLGPNGAGKSTTLRMLAGVLGPTCGTVRLCGYDLLEEPMQARRSLGYLPVNTPLYSEMTPRRYLLYRAALKGVTRTQREALMRKAASTLGCEEILDTRVGVLSETCRRRVGLADVLLCDPPILLLDEPLAGLETHQARELRGVIERLREHHAILISSCDLADIEAICTKVLVLHQGELVADDTPEALHTQYQKWGNG